MGQVPSARDRLLAEALTLSIEERLSLIEGISESLPVGTYAPELSDETKAELDRRVADFEENPGDEYTWDEVKAKLPRPR